MFHVYLLIYNAQMIKDGKKILIYIAHALHKSVLTHNQTNDG